MSVVRTFDTIRAFFLFSGFENLTIDTRIRRAQRAPRLILADKISENLPHPPGCPLGARSISLSFVKTTKILLFLLFLSSLFATGSLTAVAAPPAYQTTNSSPESNGVIAADGRVNLRSGPGTTFSVVAKLAPDTPIRVVGTNVAKDWTRVRVLATGVSGWVATQYVQQGAGGTTAQTSATTAAATTSVTTTQTATTAAPSGPVALVQSNRINVRGGPGTNYPVVSSANSGVRLPIVALNPDGTWYQVQVSGLAEPGWLLASLTQLSGSLEGVNRLTAEQIPPAPVAAAPAAAPVAAAAAPANAPAAPPPAGGGFFAYGIQAQLWQSDKGGAAEQIKQLGFGWVKQQVRWEFIEDSPGNVNWSEPDQVIEVMNGNGIQVLFSVFTAPQWTRPDKPGTGGPPNDFNLYADLVGKIASRYCGRLGAIEVWNEQNLQREWEGFPLDAGMYMDLLRRAYSSIKANCPSILVISGAPTPTGDSGVAVDDVNYLRGMYANGLARYSDGIGVHPSGFANPPDASFEDWQQGRYDAPSHVNHRSFYFRSTMEGYRRVMVEFGDSNKRLWPTEFGWASTASPYPGYEYAGRISEAQQAQYIVRSYQMMREWGWVGVATLWNLNFNEGEMSAFRVAGRPAFDALRSMPR